MRKVICLLFLAALISGCTTTPSEKSNLTVGMVKKEIIKDVTTQDDILEVFGAPNIITKNKTGNEVWTYDKISVERSYSESYGTIIIAGIGKSGASTSSRTFTLMIEFNDSGIVKDYSYRSSSF